MFLSIQKHLPDLHRLDLKTFCDRLSKDESLFEIIASYGVGGPLIFYSKCPHCQGHSRPVPAVAGQPMIGFLPPNRPLYQECQSCKLVFLSPRLPDDKMSELYDEYDFEDFKRSINAPYNPSSPRANLNIVFETFADNVRSIDLGGGVGKFSELVKRRYPRWHVEHSDFSLKVKLDSLEQLRIPSRAINFLEEEIAKENYNLATMWEVLEHIPYEKLYYVFNNVRNSLVMGGYFIFSTPDFSSPYCFIGDFFNVAPAFHTMCLSREWLTQFINEIGGWEIVQTRVNSDLVEDWNGWLEYLQECAPGPGQRGLFQALLETSSLKEYALEHSLNTSGSEFVMTLRKI